MVRFFEPPYNAFVWRMRFALLSHTHHNTSGRRNGRIVCVCIVCVSFGFASNRTQLLSHSDAQ